MNVIFAPGDLQQPKKILDAKTWVFVLAQANIAANKNIWLNHSQEEILSALQANGGVTFAAGTPLLGIPISLAVGGAVTGFWWKGEMWAMPDVVPSSIHLEISTVGKCGGGCSHSDDPQPQFYEGD